MIFAQNSIRAYLCFMKNIFPYLDDNKIEYLFDLGDTFDKNAKPDDKLIE